MSHDKVERTLRAVSDGFWLTGGIALLVTVLGALVGAETPTLSIISMVFVFVGIALGAAAWFYRRAAARAQGAGPLAQYRAEAATTTPTSDKAADQ